MNVEELIVELGKYPPDAKVAIDSDAILLNVTEAKLERDDLLDKVVLR